jgi:hypothetical protein
MTSKHSNSKITAGSMSRNVKQTANRCMLGVELIAVDALDIIAADDEWKGD